MRLVHVQQDQNHMATTFEFRVSCPSSEAAAADRALTESHQLVTRLEQELSEFDSDSPVYQLNRALPHSAVKFTEDGIKLLTHSERLRKITQSSFDCGSKSAHFVSGDMHFAWDTATRRVWRLDAGARLGFGAIGKGYALDGVRAILEGAGFRDFLLSAGGSSIFVSGFAGPGDPWKLGWSWSKDQEGNRVGFSFPHYSGGPIALGVSGTDEQGSHLIDPRHSLPARSELVSTLVAHACAADADAFSTALFVSGWEKGVAQLNEAPNPPAMAAINQDQIPVWNGLFQMLWGQTLKLGSILAIALFVFFFSIKQVLADLPVTTPAGGGEETVDLSSMGMNSFTPYIVERHWVWVVLPMVMFALVLLHLKKFRQLPKPKISVPKRRAL